MTNKIENLVESVIDTLKFQGVTVTSINFSSDEEVDINVLVSKEKQSKPLNEVLDFTYWALWSLIFGKYTQDKSSLKLNLLYKEVI